MPLSKREVNVRLCFGEVGVDLELCVHAHGHDVHRLGASCKMIIQLYDSFGILEIDSLQLRFRPCCPDLVYVNWSFAIVVLTMIDLLWFHFSDEMKYLSSTDQYPTPTSTLICRRVLPPWYLEIILELHNFLWVLHQVLHPHWFQFFMDYPFLNTQGHW